MSLECEEFNRRLMQIMQNDPDRCLMCGTDFPDRSITYGGVTSSGALEWVSECCVKQLKEVWCGGIVVSSN